MKYQKIVFNSMGGMNAGKREKNKSNVIKKISEKTNYKEIIQDIKQYIYIYIYEL